MENKKEITPESVLALLNTFIEKFPAETDRMRAQTDLMRAQTDRMRDETDRRRADFDREMEESRARLEQEMRDHDKRMKALEKHIGGLANNQGDFAEEYFFSAFRKGISTFFGEEYDSIESRKRKKIKNSGIDVEYDIQMFNCISVGLIETKYKLTFDDIKKTIIKVGMFRDAFPQFANHKLYLGIASMIFEKKVEDECIRQGIAVIKQVGDNVVINDKNLKQF
ncbi:MAG: hypothetical protein FWH18_09955 [Marinilabiliaceae bacterium]|nr:hypothetical protein [Marinilabiliaceae bacterium]